MNKYILIIVAGTVLLATSCKKKRSEPDLLINEVPPFTKGVFLYSPAAWSFHHSSPDWHYPLTFNKPALMATTTVLTVINTAPIAGLSKIPWLYSTPAASGRVTTL